MTGPPGPACRDAPAYAVFREGTTGLAGAFPAAGGITRAPAGGPASSLARICGVAQAAA
jgi:hypothetical protein